jgi:hypothetical protein
MFPYNQPACTAKSRKRLVLSGTPCTNPVYLVTMTQMLNFLTSSHSLLPLKLLFTSPPADTPFMIPLEGKVFVP